MIKKPIFAKVYLNIIHTPLHYFRTLKINNFNKNYKLRNLLKINVVLITTLFSIFILQNKDNKYLKIFENKYNDLWWISPIIGHIILNEIINISNKIKLIKCNNYKNYINVPIVIANNYKNYLYFLM
tara:strand:- start:181 stop:561 length:381 start_codon:yes stop_codon:yes gene_type:complete